MATTITLRLQLHSGRTWEAVVDCHAMLAANGQWWRRAALWLALHAPVGALGPHLLGVAWQARFTPVAR